ncbi:MAG: hypothetical protein AB1757_25280 [Acidobacteriota bacterium]
MKNRTHQSLQKFFLRIKKAKALILIAAMFAALCYYPQSQLACGPFFNQAYFTFTVHPDFPLDQYAAGELGVIQSSYARSYLYVAYRYFAGLGFDSEEQKAIVAMWRHRLREDEYNQPKGDNQVARWLEARSKVPGVEASPNIEIYKNANEEFFSYANCTEDAFKNAAKLLQERIAKYGATSPLVKEWLQAQDQVFANCLSNVAPPAPTPASAPAWLQADRAYQIAAANFYGDKWDEAEKGFSQIATDKNSPYRLIAPYLAARALVRKSTLSVDDQKRFDEPLMKEAEARLKKILSDASYNSVHSAARGTLNFVNYRLHPEARLTELAQALLRKNSGKTIWQDLWDYTALMDKYTTDDLDDFSDEKKKSEHLPTIGRNDDLTDWLFVFQVEDKPALDYAVQKWTKTGALAWLVSALTKVGANHPRAGELISAAMKVKADSPAYATLAYHTARLLIDGNKKDEARKMLDSLLTSRTLMMPQSARNQFMGLRLKVALSLDDLLKFAARKPAGFSYDDDGREVVSTDLKDSDDPKLREFAAGRLAFDTDIYYVLNSRLPLSLLKEAAASRTLPDYLRREVAQAAWVRAVLLDDHETGKALATLLQTLAPDLKNELSTYLAAATPDDKKLTALYILLRNPGAEPYVDSGVGRSTSLKEIDNYRDNWWCAEIIRSEDKLAAASAGDDPEAQKYIKESNTNTSESPDFLTAAQRATAEKESAKLRALGNAPNYLCQQIVNFANTKATDPRLAEALHLAVKATRYGCTDKDTGRFSKLAYDTLHKKYPRSEWAAKTKYWFKGN